MRFFSFILLLSACTTQDIRFDLNLVQEYKFEMEKSAPHAPPYTGRFEKDGKQLVYIAALHVNGSTKPLESSTFRAIRVALDQYRPRVAIVEGYKTGVQISPSSLFAHAEKCEAEGYLKCGEPSYLIQEARKRGMEFISGEPIEPDIYKNVLASGWSEADLLGFYLVRQIPQWRATGELKDFEKRAPELMAFYQKEFGATEKFGLTEFKEWYKKNGLKKSYIDISTNDIAPNSAGDATYLQKISSTIGRVRDRAIVVTIEKMLNRFSNVLIVYGASHFLTQRPALENALGSPTFSPASR